MQNLNDIETPPPVKGVRGNLSRARRRVCGADRLDVKAEGNRRARRVVRLALRGFGQEVTRYAPVTAWWIS